MSTGTSSSAHDGHLDDERTLDALDGVLDPAGRAHLTACTACATEVRRLRRAQAAVAGPTPPVDDATREAAIAAALAASDEIDVGTGRSGDARDLAGRRRARHPGTSRAPGRRAWATTGRWIGVAAAVVALVTAVPLLFLVGGSGEDQQSASPAADDAVGAAGGEESATALAAPSDVVAVGDLGPLDQGADLRPVVDRALGASDAGGGAPEAAEAEAGSAVPAPRATAAQVEPCQEEVRRQLPELGALLLVGTATVDGRPSHLLGFDAPGAARPTVSVVVVASETCELLTFQAYARG